jgi:tagaturonate epimerase
LIHIKTHDSSYRLNLYSGSDKFSLDPVLAEITRNKGLCQNSRNQLLAFFFDIYQMARQRYLEDRATYYVSADINQMPDIESSRIDPDILNHFHVRQALHVTFGSILALYGEDLHQFLRQNEVSYLQTIRQHFDKHLDPFCT